MSKVSIPKPPPPSVSEFTHSFISLNWNDYYLKLQNAMHGEKILCEISLCEEKSKEWKRIYIGYASNCKADNLRHVCKYAFRLRFKIREEWSVHSEPIIVSTLEPPMTGENLHRAIRSNNVVEAERVLVQGKVNIEAQDNLGFTPLMVAAQNSLSDMMKLLVSRGGDLEAKTESGKTALMLASFKGEWQSIELLIKMGAKLNNIDRSHLTALHYAVDGEHSRSVRILGAAGAMVDPVDSVLGWSPLLRCAGLKNNGNVDVAKDLIKLGAKVNLQDKDGNSALFIAVMNCHVKMCEILIASGADIFLQNKNKNTPFKLAQTSDNLNLKAILTNAKQASEIKEST